MNCPACFIFRSVSFFSLALIRSFNNLILWKNRTWMNISPTYLSTSWRKSSFLFTSCVCFCFELDALEAGLLPQEADQPLLDVELVDRRLLLEDLDLKLSIELNHIILYVLFYSNKINIMLYVK